MVSDLVHDRQRCMWMVHACIASEGGVESTERMWLSTTSGARGSFWSRSRSQSGSETHYIDMLKNQEGCSDVKRKISQSFDGSTQVEQKIPRHNEGNSYEWLHMKKG